MSDKEYKPWEGDSIEESLPKHKTVDPDEGFKALTGIREKMGKVLKKDQALKVSMNTPKHERKQIIREEGEVWKEGDKTYEWKHGVKQGISKLQDAKTPIFCPDCGKILRSKLDSKMVLLRKMCHDCLVPIETQMRLDGKWEMYEHNIMLANCIARAADGVQELRGYKDMIGNPQIIFQDGTFEVWNMPMDEIKEDLEAEAVLLENWLEELRDEYNANLEKLQSER